MYIYIYIHMYIVYRGYIIGIILYMHKLEVWRGLESTSRYLPRAHDRFLQSPKAQTLGVLM